MFENGCYVGRAWKGLYKVWIPEALRAGEFSALECRQKVEGSKEGPFSIESSMPHVSCDVQLTTQHLREIGQDFPPLVEVVRVRSHTKQKDLACSLKSRFFLSPSKRCCTQGRPGFQTVLGLSLS